jgi:hypothetical protein
MGATVRIATVDWPRVVNELRGQGMMLCAIDRRVGVAPSTLGNLAYGLTREPCYSVGVRLLELRARLATAPEHRPQP